MENSIVFHASKNVILTSKNISNIDKFNTYVSLFDRFSPSIRLLSPFLAMFIFSFQADEIIFKKADKFAYFKHLFLWKSQITC